MSSDASHETSKSMTYRKTIPFLLLVSVISSCATLKSDKLVGGQIPLTKDNLVLINGDFSRASINQPNKHNGDLFWNFNNKGYNVGPDSLCFVRIKVVNEKRLDVTLLNDDGVIKSKILKGRLKNGYFEMNRRSFIVPGIFLNVCRTTKFRIGLLNNKNLTTDYKEIAWGTGFVIIPFFEKGMEKDFEYGKH